ncbi:hypothetical protein AAG906_029251 [Vitis piasezkii]
MLSGPSVSNLIKSLGRETRAILVYTARSTFDGTMLSHLRQLVTARIPPPIGERAGMTATSISSARTSGVRGFNIGAVCGKLLNQRQRCPHLPGAVRQLEEMKAISNGARPWRGDSWRASDKCKLSSRKQQD